MKLGTVARAVKLTESRKADVAYGLLLLTAIGRKLHGAAQMAANPRDDMEVVPFTKQKDALLIEESHPLLDTVRIAHRKPPWGLVQDVGDERPEKRPACQQGATSYQETG